MGLSAVIGAPPASVARRYVFADVWAATRYGAAIAAPVSNLTTSRRLIEPPCAEA